MNDEKREILSPYLSPKDIQDLEQIPLIPIKRSKDDLPVPFISGPKGPIALHSLYNAARDLPQAPQNFNGLCIQVGLGNGQGAYSLLPYCTELWVVVQKGSPDLAQSLQIPEVRTILKHKKTRLLFLDAQESLQSTLSEHYHPSFQGALYLFQNTVLAKMQNLSYGPWAQEVQQQMLFWKSQGPTFRYFGRRWGINMARNISQGKGQKWPLLPHKDVLITGAGPSLEKAKNLYSSFENKTIIATDTSLPWLKAQGIKPWAVVVLDAQHHSLKHFIGIRPEDIGKGGLFADLGVHPALSRTYGPLHYFFSGHPLTYWLEQMGLQLPRIQTGLGNVSAVALDIARRLGCEEATLLGTDFSVPKGKTYARGTYLPILWQSKSTRVQDNLQQNLIMVWQRQGYWKEGTWHSPLLDNYLARLNEYIVKNGPRCTLIAQNKSFGSYQKIHQTSSLDHWPEKEFLETYEHIIQELEEIKTPLWQYRKKLNQVQNSVFQSLFPWFSTLEGQNPSLFLTQIKKDLDRFKK